MTEEFSIWNSHVISTSLARDYRGASQNRKFDRGVLFFGSKSFIKCSSYVSNKKIRIWLSNYRTFYFHGPPYCVTTGESDQICMTYSLSLGAVHILRNKK